MKIIEPRYPADALVLRVNARGRIALDGYAYFVGTTLTGQRIGLRRVDEKLHVLFHNLQFGPLESKPQRRA